MKNEIYDVIVAGAGASGLAAAAEAARRGLGTILLERNSEPAKKIYATGNGRCNYSNADAPHSSEVVGKMRMHFGLEPALEDSRIYPRSFEASSVARLLISEAKSLGVEIICGARVITVQKNAQGFVVECEDGRRFHARNFILATGGKAGIQYGCTGDGYDLAMSLGHRIVKPIPALDGLCCREDIQALHGVRVRADARLEISDRGQDFRTAADDSGEVQFTKNGISGICVMNLSRFLRLSEGRRFRLVIDAFPEYSTKELSERIQGRKNRFGYDLLGMIPEKFAAYLHQICPDNNDPARMADAAKNISFSITGTRGWKTAQVTCGGVELGEIDNATFESLIVPGLFITGELTDYDGPCGGFNLNYALYSGLCAGRSVSLLPKGDKV